MAFTPPDAAPGRNPMAASGLPTPGETGRTQADSLTAAGLPAHRAPRGFLLAMGLGYAVFALLLNSVGVVILQSIGYFHVDAVKASTLEAAKDLTIALVSFLVAAQVPVFGLRRSMIAALVLAGAGCVLAAMADAFWAVRLMFVATGVGFALMKVAVYAAIGVVSHGPSDHARRLALVEAGFMAAVVASGWLFAGFIDPARAGDGGWLHVYWLLAGVAGVAALGVAAMRLEERPLARPAAGKPAAGFAGMMALLALVSTWAFIFAVFLYVFIEQGLGTWLPTINHQVLGLDGRRAVQAASAFAVAIALGRLVAGLVVARLGWFRLMLGCLAGMAALIATVPGLARAGAVVMAGPVPVAAAVLPLVGFFMAPLYPTLNSVVLAALPRDRQAGLIGLVVVFSALGGTLGSRLVAELFAVFPDARVLYVLLAPMALLAGLVVALKRLTRAV